MENKKRLCLVCVLFLLLFGITMSLSAAEESKPQKADDNEKTLTISKVGSSYQIGRSNDTATFWEFPVLTPGQSRNDGTLTLKSEIAGDAVIDMTKVTLPYDNEEALGYLNALHLHVVDEEGNVIYDDSYVHIADRDENGKMNVLKITLKGGESRTYHIGLSCDFGYTGKTNPGNVLVYTYLVDVGTPAWIDYSAYIGVAVVILIVVVVLFIIIRNRKTSFGADFKEL